jgi:hypothetical protein
MLDLKRKRRTKMAKEAVIELKYRRCGGCINYYYGQCILEPTWIPTPPEHLCGRGVWIEWSAESNQFATFYHGEPKTLTPPDAREEVARDMEFQPQAPRPNPVPVEAPESVVEAEIEQIREDVARSMEAKEKAVAQAPRAARIMAPPMSLQEMMDYLKKNPPPPRA